jgi:2,4'-dihydroxyacetophenone dioxygenase
LEKTLHIHSQELPYIETSPGMEMRLLQARVENGFYITQVRAAPGCVSGLHKHPFRKGVGGYTLRGRWGHDHRYLYRPGTYIFETPDVVHQFFNGTEEAEVIFLGDFAESMLRTYIELCAKRGFKPHYLT